MQIEEFIKEYAEEISQKSAAVFIGAGMSRASGYLDWKELVRPLAKKINLDIDRECNLVKVMQYYENEYGRQKISKEILNKFQGKEHENKNLKTLTNLPIETYWTTNYDDEIERYLRENNKKIDLKISNDELSVNVENRDAVILSILVYTFYSENVRLSHSL